MGGQDISTYTITEGRTDLSCCLLISALGGATPPEGATRTPAYKIYRKIFVFCVF